MQPLFSFDFWVKSGQFWHILVTVFGGQKWSDGQKKWSFSQFLSFRILEIGEKWPNDRFVTVFKNKSGQPETRINTGFAGFCDRFFIKLLFII